MKKKVLIFPLMLLLLCMYSGIPSFAVDNAYYLVDGRVYADGEAIINRVDIIENAPTVETRRGDGGSYVLAALNDDWEEIALSVLGINFEISADAGGGYSDYAEFSALIPYDPQITAFVILNGDYDIIADAYLDETVQSEILYFNVEKTNGGYNLEWEVELYDDDYSSLLEYDVMTVSTKSGESNVLAYRINETTLFVPYDWLDPNDTVVFTLKSNDTRTTLTAVSDKISTPKGAEKIIADNDAEWGDSDTDGETAILLYVALAAACVIIIALVIALIVIVKRKK